MVLVWMDASMVLASGCVGSKLISDLKPPKPPLTLNPRFFILKVTDDLVTVCFACGRAKEVIVKNKISIVVNLILDTYFFCPCTGKTHCYQIIRHSVFCLCKGKRSN